MCDTACSLVNTDERPAAASVVATQMKRLIAICQRQDLRQPVTCSNGCPNAIVDEFDAVSLVFHRARCCPQVATESHA